MQQEHLPPEGSTTTDVHDRRVALREEYRQKLANQGLIPESARPAGGES